MIYKWLFTTVASIAALPIGLVAAGAIDILTNKFNGNELPDQNFDFSGSESILVAEDIPRAYIQASDLRLPEITITDTNGYDGTFITLHSVDSDETGFTAIAYQDQESGHVIISFNGMSKPWYDTTNTPFENPWQSWDDILTGVESRFSIVNRQMRDLYNFMDDVTELAGPNATYESIGYSLGGIHGLHALASWNLPFHGMSPAGLPNHPDLYSQEELDRLSLTQNFSLSSSGDFITGVVGNPGNIINLPLSDITACDPSARIDSIGPHILPTGYGKAFATGRDCGLNLKF
ncbi:MAG: hypothetical protein AAF549_08355 [Pseudomonadota bacterium]